MNNKKVFIIWLIVWITTSLIPMLIWWPGRSIVILLGILSGILSIAIVRFIDSYFN